MMMLLNLNQLISCYLCDRMGPAYTVQGGAIVNIIGSITTPYISRNVGVMGVIILRFLMGCGQGVMTPCMHVLIAHWFPLGEKSTAVALATTGNQVLLNRSCSYFCKSRFKI